MKQIKEYTFRDFLPSCNKCSPLMINGVFVHETGCPNGFSRWDKETGEWYVTVECRECGCEVREGKVCDCQDLGDLSCVPAIRHPDWETIGDMLNSREWDRYIGDRLGNDPFISDPDRARRICDAAEFGADGSTHAENIQDWVEFLGGLSVYDPEYDDPEGEYYITRAQYDALLQECSDREMWYEKNGTLNQQCG